MSRILYPCLVLAGLLPAALPGQTTSLRPGIASLHVGVGGHQGWIGAAAEVYVVPGRLSAIGGVGVLPVWGAQVAWGGAVRYYPLPAAVRHRPFVDVSWTLLRLTQDDAVSRPVKHWYGPGMMIGYSYLAHSGWTFTSGFGLARPDADGLLPLVHLALGWTWRR